MRRTVAVLVYVFLTTMVWAGASVYEIPASGRSVTSSIAIVAFYFAAILVIAAFAVWTADELGLPSLLVLSEQPARAKLVSLAVHGLGLGLLIAIGSLLLSGEGGEAALRPWFWRRIQTPMGTLLFSARAALLEETFFRLFLIPFLVSLALRTRRPRYALQMSGGSARVTTTTVRAPRWLVPAAVLVSSLLFGIAHPYNPIPAMLLAPLLAIAFLRSGWESAVLAHFTANFLVFSFYF